MRAPTSAIVAGAAVALLGVAFSCKTFDIPDETCDPSRLHPGALMTPLSDSTCNRCLEDSCCDLVGVCERKSGCVETVAAVHACVLGEGRAAASKETECAIASRLDATKEAEDAYRCMRDRCGSACGLPVCRVDPAAPLIHSAGCDGCLASSCCPQLNECYASRACKLTVECIVAECGAALGSRLATDVTSGAPANDLCAAPTDPSPEGCVRRCLCAFQNNDPGLPPKDDEKRPLVLALNVYRCGVSASCGPSCTTPPSP